jgi:tetratricopeptide (TPR) repeat protein
MAQTAVKLGQWPGALQEFQTTIQLNPDHYDARLEIAKVLIYGRGYAAAKEQLDLLVQKQPNNPDVYLALATYYDAATKDTGAALAALHKALQLDPNRSESYRNLGILDAQGQQWVEAEANLKKAVELAPNSVDALVTLGNFYQTRGRYPEAEQEYRRAIQSVPNDPSPRLTLAGLLHAWQFLSSDQPDRQSPRRIHHFVPGTSQGSGGPQELHQAAHHERSFG